MVHWAAKPSHRNKAKRWFRVDVPTVDYLATIPDDVLATRSLPKGFYLWFLVHHMHHIYAVSSSDVKLTRGVMDYLYDYTRWGPNKTRSKLFLCSVYNRTGNCDNGFLCREVHCALSTDDAVDADTYNITSNANGCPTVAEEATDATHVPEGVLLRHSLHTRWTPPWVYPRLESGVTFRIALPNTPTPVEEFDSGQLFVTKVTREHYDRIMRNESPTVTLQHCANLSKNGMCCFGENCQFAHVVHYTERQDADDASHTGSIEMTLSASACSQVNKVNNNSSSSDGGGVTPLASTPSCSVRMLSSKTSSTGQQAQLSQYAAPQGVPQEGAMPAGNFLIMPQNVMSSGYAFQPPAQKQAQRTWPLYAPSEGLNCAGPIGNSFVLLPGSDQLCTVIVPQWSEQVPAPTTRQPFYMMHY